MRREFPPKVMVAAFERAKGRCENAPDGWGYAALDLAAFEIRSLSPLLSGEGSHSISEDGNDPSISATGKAESQ